MGDYEVIEAGGVPIKAWTRGVPVEAAARQQLANISRLPIVFRHVAAMPDVHLGKGATVGSVSATSPTTLIATRAQVNALRFLFANDTPATHVIPSEVEGSLSCDAGLPAPSPATHFIPRLRSG